MPGDALFRIGVDTGGTFTDVVAIRSTDGAIFSFKVPSTPSDPSLALQAAIREILRAASAPPEKVHAFVHGTTVATNALLEREDHNMGLIVNEGFRFLLGMAGGLYRITLNPGTSRERVVPALSNRVPAKKGDIIRVVTTGGGGWGDPLEREAERVRQDVIWGKVTPEGARRDYGVVIEKGEDAQVDAAGTEKLRSLLRKKRGRKRPFFDRTVRAIPPKPGASAKRAAAKRGRAPR
ncbi:MAG: hydantoinase/oxoprolinase N-terminal domain-containing protein [Nitrospinota bacterium]